ncbi:MAG: PD-(D/E)XK nuclease family protein, partial [Clostridia bacterium]|nr:PD-(D/E)XK nuclease family protein [Clostridia bacterium]
PEDLTRVADELPEGVLKHKLTDMARLFSAYQDVLKNGYTDNADRLLTAQSLLPLYHPLDRSVVFLDGFDVFTSRLYQFITALLCRCDVVIALSDAEGGSDRAAYEIFEQTKEKLLTCARDAGTEVKIEHIPFAASGRSDEILFLQNAFYARKPMIFPGTPANLALNQYASPVDEVIGTAEEIARGVRTGARFRDYAVLCNDLPAYSPVISNIFTRYGIPVYTDVKHDITTHPVAMYLFSLLKCALFHFRPDIVSDYLLSNLTPVSREDADRFLSFIKEAGVTGYELEKGLYEKRGDDEAQAAFDRVRLMLIPPLQAFSSCLFSCKNAREMASCCYDFLLGQGVYERIDALVDKYESSDYFALSDVTAQLWNTVVRLLNDMSRLLGDQIITPKAFYETLFEGFAASPVSTIPSVLDSVTFGDLKAAREARIKHIFIIGVNEGIIPAVFSDDRLVTPQESDILTAHGMELAHTAGTEDARIRYQVYAAFTQAEDTLTVSCPLYSASGASLRPSRLFARLKTLFPRLPIAAPAPRTPREEMNEPFTSSQLKWALAQDRLASPESKLLYEHLKNEGDPVASFLDFALKGKEDALSPGLARTLFAPEKAVSVSRLETFASCPLKHFFEYGLRPAEDKEFTASAVDVGTLIHGTLESFVRESRGQDLSQEACTSLVASLFDKKLPDTHFGAFLSTARQRALNDNLRALTCRCAWEIKQQLDAFEPIGEEISFGYDKYAPLRIETAYGTLLFKGKIDRADKCERDGTVYLRIVDYKTGSKTFSDAAVERGTDLQLMMYMNALLAHYPEGRPAAAYYMQVSKEAEKMLSGKALADFAEKGISEEAFAALLQKASDSAHRQTEGILSGDI